MCRVAICVEAYGEVRVEGETFEEYDEQPSEAAVNGLKALVLANSADADGTEPVEK